MLAGAVASFARFETEASQVGVSVALEGGDASCKFTLLRCVNQGGDSPWRPERDWTAKAKDSTSVRLGGVDASSARGAEGQEHAAGVLEALLTAYVTG